MTVTLNVEREKFLEETVASGRYATTNEAVEAAFDLFEERERKFRELKRDIQAGIDQLDRGEGIVVPREKLHDFFLSLRRS